MLAKWRGKAAFAALIAGPFGCATPDERLPASPPVPMCTLLENCGHVGRAPVDNGAGPSGEGSGSAGDPKLTDVTGEVAVALTAELDQLSPFGGVARVQGPGPKGAIIEALYGPGTSGAFTLNGVLAGDQWLFVQDDTAGGAGVFSTFSLQPLSSPAKLVVPALDRAVIETIAQDDPSSPLIDPARAQILLALTQDSAPASGVSITSGAATALVIYDEGAGIYSSQAEATGSAGVILLINAAAPSGGGAFTIQGADAAGNLFQVTVPTAPGAATIGQIEI
jgi:hypothetical protein